MKKYKFPQGEMPAVGLGTWKMEDGTATAAVKMALECGYRHIDCAPIYLNEPDVGTAFAEVFGKGDIKREDVWVTSKLWCNRHRPDLVQGALEKTLADLQLDYLDLFMIHWPVVFRHDVHRPESAADMVPLEDMPLNETWKALESCLEAGLCRNIGVCNFSVKKLKIILEDCKVPPSANQVECHPFFPQTELLEFCQNNDIQFVGYSPLGSGDRPERMRDESDPNMFESPEILKLAESRGLSPGQIILAWAVNRGTAPIPKSTNAQRLADNLAAGAIEFSSDEMAAIDGIATNHRYVHGRFWEMEGGPYTVANLWDE
ncbi:MAG: aldo/keto reductase [Mariniblastus sp.]